MIFASVERGSTETTRLQHGTSVFGDSRQRRDLEGGVENVQYATNHKKKGGRKRTCGPQCKVCLTLRAQSLPRDLLAGASTSVVVQHLIRGLYHKLEKRPQPLVRLSGRSMQYRIA